MTNTQVTTAEELQQKIEGKIYRYFTLPILDITIKYRRPDLLKLSFNGFLPQTIAGAVIDAYKYMVEGGDQKNYKNHIEQKELKADDEFIKELGTKGYDLLTQLVVSHKILDVPQSDFSNNVISWNDIPEEDAVAFLLYLVNSAQVAETEDGGEVSAQDIENFPDKGHLPKRDNTSKSRKAIR